MGASLMARNIFNQPPKDENDSAVRSPTPPKAAKLPGSVGGLRDSLREITANSIRDLDPDQIDMDGLRDRLVLEDSSIHELAESIRKHGQQVPIMVRPSAQPDRYRIVYGRRRLAALRMVGGMVKAIVRTLDDDATLIAQGQENNLRLDPSFIEKSLFIKEMQESGYKPNVIQDALGLTRQGVSNHRVVIEQLPDGLVQLIGPAHGIGRRQWGDLAALSNKVDLVNTAKEVIAALPDDTPSPEKFQAVFSACSSKARRDKKPNIRGLTSVVKDKDGGSVGTLTIDEKTIAIKIARKDNPEFGRWLEERAEATLLQLFEQWRNESGSGS
ncbi:plasmid partitioning protein RepB [Marivita sp.]|jgi:ParB family chromosome partitioning protein|uniref:plasmid partitioning protein RepB n=1 Tax=Marivita sp. TaxID=2003365 RepID=UPI003B51A170